jgi:hypothetical protein
VPRRSFGFLGVTGFAATAVTLAFAGVAFAAVVGAAESWERARIRALGGWFDAKRDPEITWAVAALTAAVSWIGSR